MEPDDVICQFEQLALDDETELPSDDAIAGLAVLPGYSGEGEGVADGGRATLYRLGLNVLLRAALGL